MQKECRQKIQNNCFSQVSFIDSFVIFFNYKCLSMSSLSYSLINYCKLCNSEFLLNDAISSLVSYILRKICNFSNDFVTKLRLLSNFCSQIAILLTNLQQIQFVWSFEIILMSFDCNFCNTIQNFLTFLITFRPFKIFVKLSQYL